MAKESAFEAWLTSVNQEESCVLATILETEKPVTIQDGFRMFISEKGTQIGHLGSETINQQIRELALIKMNTKTPKSETLTFALSEQEEISVFIDVYIPPINILIFGAGHDAIPVANYSVSLGLRTTVVDSRAFYNSEERFPNTTRIVTNDTAYKEMVHIGTRSYVILMNHHLERDQEALKFVLNSQAPYIGVLGPRSRRVRMIDALEEEGIVITEEQLSRVYSPIGLDIGASSSEEIAISILAEIIALRNGHNGGFLRGSEYIHKN
ncbi:XdhC family protein [Sporosarcina sp. CAU 1771]